MHELKNVIDKLFDDNDFYTCHKCGVNISIHSDVCETCNYNHSELEWNNMEVKDELRKLV